MLFLVVHTQNMDLLEHCCKQIMQKALQACCKSIGFEIFNTDTLKGDLQTTTQHMAKVIVQEILHLPDLIRPKIVLYKTKSSDRALIKEIFRKEVHNALVEQQKHLHTHTQPLLGGEGRGG